MKIVKRNEVNAGEKSPKLMVGGTIQIGSNGSQTAEVRRGMAILSNEGWEVGKVAAVVLDENSGQVSCILLSRLPEMSGYWQVPLEYIMRVDGDELRLQISTEAAAALVCWCSP